VDYAMLVKNYRAPQPEMQTERRYSPEPVVAVAKTPIAGNPNTDFYLFLACGKAKPNHADAYAAFHTA
jgi:hypothetical protein